MGDGVVQAPTGASETGKQVIRWEGEGGGTGVRPVQGGGGGVPSPVAPEGSGKVDIDRFLDDGGRVATEREASIGRLFLFATLFSPFGVSVPRPSLIPVGWGIGGGLLDKIPDLNMPTRRESGLLAGFACLAVSAALFACGRNISFFKSALRLI